MKVFIYGIDLFNNFVIVWLITKSKCFTYIFEWKVEYRYRFWLLIYETAFCRIHKIINFENILCSDHNKSFITYAQVSNIENAEFESACMLHLWSNCGFSDWRHYYDRPQIVVTSLVFIFKRRILSIFYIHSTYILLQNAVRLFSWPPLLHCNSIHCFIWIVNFVFYWLINDWKEDILPNFYDFHDSALKKCKEN